MILVFGKTGQVARELARLDPGARFLSREDVDLAHPGTCAEAILSARPEAVINAAAYTAVDQAEAHQDLAMTVNGRAPGAMAQACAELGIPIVHISTEYVFDGAGSDPLPVDRTPEPLSAYGHSKLAGEESVRAAGGIHVILRTSWVFASHGSNFVKTILQLAEMQNFLKVVSDQIGGPTPARDLAAACLGIAHQLHRDPAKTGTYHFCGHPHVSRAEFAREILGQAGSKAPVEEVPTSAFPAPAKRPSNGRLDCAGLDRLGLSPPDWKSGLAEVIAELGDQ